MDSRPLRGGEQPILVRTLANFAMPDPAGGGHGGGSTRPDVGKKGKLYTLLLTIPRGMLTCFPLFHVVMAMEVTGAVPLSNNWSRDAQRRRVPPRPIRQLLSWGLRMRPPRMFPREREREIPERRWRKRSLQSQKPRGNGRPQIMWRSLSQTNLRRLPRGKRGSFLNCFPLVRSQLLSNSFCSSDNSPLCRCSAVEARSSGVCVRAPCVGDQGGLADEDDDGAVVRGA